MKHTDKMAFYDNMLAELKALRAKTPDPAKPKRPAVY